MPWCCIIKATTKAAVVMKGSHVKKATAHCTLHSHWRRKVIGKSLLSNWEKLIILVNHTIKKIHTVSYTHMIKYGNQKKLLGEL